ncbi:MAG: MBL fold metallo-hydrolase [Proteobacteria bacterium]|nr:MBL fold metallo-hydrolase [Pseudomonadota bacterium]
MFKTLFIAGFVCGVCNPAHAQTSFPVKVIPGAVPADRSPDGNTVIFEDPDGLIVVDTGRHFAHQAAIIAYSDARKKPITAIVNTHWHLDHSGGNQELRVLFPNAKLYTSHAVNGALDGFLAKELERSRAMAADPKVNEYEKSEIRLGISALEDRKDLIPDVPVTGDMALGRLALHLAPFAATEGDTWLYDPQSRTVVAGDLIVAPVPFFDTACGAGWRAALDKVAAQSFDRIIPGHGPSLTRGAFEDYRKAFGRLLDCAASPAAAASCAEGWRKDAAQFMTSDAERAYADRAIVYYLDNILRVPAKQAELCGAQKE